MRLGIGSWTYGWATGVSGFPRPARRLSPIELVSRAQTFGLDLVQLGDNLSVHELPPGELAQLRDRAGESGIGIELGTVGAEKEHLLRYLDLALFFGARLIRTLLPTPRGEA